MDKLVQLTLPAFAFLEGSGHENPDVLKGRNIVYHVRSASVIEILERENAFFTEDSLMYNFSYTNRYGVRERMVAVLHYSATLDKDADRQMLIDEVMKPAAMWYCDYCTWEDENIENERP